MKFHRSLLPIVAALLAPAGSALAAPSLSLFDTTGDPASVTASPGDQVTIQVLLHSDTIDFSGLSYYLKASTAGKFAVINRVSATWPASPANGLTDAITPGLPPPTSPPPTTLLDTTINSVDLGYSARFLSPNITHGDYSIDTLTISIDPSTPAGTYQILTSASSVLVTTGGSSPNFTFTPTSIPVSSYTINVLVPEPATLGLLAAGTLLILGRRRPG